MHLSIDTSVKGMALASGKNISSLVESFLRDYFIIPEGERPDLDSLRARLAADQAELKMAEAAEKESKEKERKGWI